MIRFFSCVALMCTACSPTTPSGPREVCGNGLDDDNNGKIDCLDADCAGKDECYFDGGFFGSCGKCGRSCERQTECLTTSLFNDAPLPYCEAKKCTSFLKNVQVDVVLNAQQAWGTNIALAQSITFRFIRKTKLDGVPVNCDTVLAAAPGRLAADAKQLEDNGGFFLYGIDSRSVRNPSGSLPVRFVNVLTTNSDYLIWMELWGGTPDSSTKYPTGRRLGFECFEGPSPGVNWSPIVEADNCVLGGDGGTSTCRQFQVTATRGRQP